MPWPWADSLTHMLFVFSWISSRAGTKLQNTDLQMLSSQAISDISTLFSISILFFLRLPANCANNDCINKQIKVFTSLQLHLITLKISKRKQNSNKEEKMASWSLPCLSFPGWRVAIRKHTSIWSAWYEFKNLHFYSICIFLLIEHGH